MSEQTPERIAEMRRFDREMEKLAGIDVTAPAPAGGYLATVHRGGEAIVLDDETLATQLNLNSGPDTYYTVVTVRPEGEPVLREALEVTASTCQCGWREDTPEGRGIVWRLYTCRRVAVTMCPSHSGIFRARCRRFDAWGEIHLPLSRWGRRC